MKKHARGSGTIAMARQGDPHSAAAQFYFNLVDNGGSLDPRPSRWGYAVFGKVIDGMDIADAIVGVPTKNVGMHQNVPVEPIVIESITQARQ